MPKDNPPRRAGFGNEEQARRPAFASFGVASIATRLQRCDGIAGKKNAGPKAGVLANARLRRGFGVAGCGKRCCLAA